MSGVLVSACLLGVPCRYDGASKPAEGVKDMCGECEPFCPEAEGGLPTPRAPAEIIGGDGHDVLEGRARVVNANGEDVTLEYIAGAKKALELCEARGIDRAVLKAKSPSCGCGLIYDGTFTGAKRRGDGVTAAMLKRAGITVTTEEELHEGK